MVKFYLTDLASKDPDVQIVPLAAWTENKKMKFYLTKGQEVRRQSSVLNPASFERCLIIVPIHIERDRHQTIQGAQMQPAIDPPARGRIVAILRRGNG